MVEKQPVLPFVLYERQLAIRRDLNRLPARLEAATCSARLQLAFPSLINSEVLRHNIKL